MLKLTVVGLLIATTANMFAADTINVLDYKIDLNTTETLSSIREKIVDRVGYKVILAIPNCYIDTEKEYKVSDLPDIGSVLKHVYAECDAYPHVVQKRKTIIMKKTVAKKYSLDPSWPIVSTKKTLSEAFPDIAFRIDGKGILYAYGPSESIEKIDEIMENIKTISSNEVTVYFDILPYITNTKDDTFIGYQKNDPFIKISGEEVSLKQARIKHGTPVQLNVSGRNVEVMYDAVHNAFIFDQSYGIPIARFTDLGYVITGADNRKWIITIRDFN